MSENGAALIWCPFPDRESARDISIRLLDGELIACANIIGEVEAIFEWNSERSEGREVAVLLKTTYSKLDSAIARLGDLHPYDTPAILGWRCDSAHPATSEWLLKQLG